MCYGCRGHVSPDGMREGWCGVPQINIFGTHLPTHFHYLSLLTVSVLIVDVLSAL